MPIHDVGYRKWDGERTSEFSRWMIICKTGLQLSAKSAWVRRILLAAWLPVMYWGVGFFFLEKTIEAENNTSVSVARQQFDESFEKAIEDAPEHIKQAGRKGKNKALEGIEAGGSADIKKMVLRRFAIFPHADELIAALDSGDQQRIRKDVWRWMLMVFFRYPQSLLILFLIGIVAPSLISRDLRSRAFLLYFSRPIGKIEYILGKLCIPAVFITAITTLPALALYLFAIMMSPSLTVFWATWDIPIRIIIATLALVIPTSSIALMLSSLTHESRFANFSWFAIWALGHGAWMAIAVATAIGMRQNLFSPEVMQSAQVNNWSVLSLYNCLGDVQEYIFGFETLQNIWRAAAAIGFVTIFSLVVLYRRVAAPVRV